MYDACGKLLNGIKSMYVNRLAYFRVKGGECECFRVKSGVGQGCIISPWLLNVYMDAVMKEVKMGLGGGDEISVRGKGGLLYANDLVLCGESEEDLGAMVGCLLRCVGEEV